jgi:hypothetical protein
MIRTDSVAEIPLRFCSFYRRFSGHDTIFEYGCSWQGTRSWASCTIAGRRSRTASWRRGGARRMAAPPLCAPVAAVLPEIHLHHACSCHEVEVLHARPAQTAAATASSDRMQSSARVHAELRLHDWRELGFQVRPNGSSS